jgi:dihydroorotate dehydrogenase
VTRRPLPAPRRALHSQMLYRLLRPLLFRLDAERAHRLAVAAASFASSTCARLRFAPRPHTHPRLTQELWGITFPNPVGLAAGFDKDARAPYLWPLLGFGFAELGTITAEAQPGNPPPRLLRLPADRALINRLGFNSEGAAAVAARLGRSSRQCSATIPLGINIGKSRVTALEDAAADYVRSFRQLFPFASYVAVNVSSPNTPALRDLQAEGQLAALLSALSAENRGLAQAYGCQPRPLLIKLAPDLADEAYDAIVRVARATGAAGFVATNTTIARQGLQTVSDMAGGLSGAPLRARATAVIRHLYRLTHGDLPIIGVGGVFSASDAYEKIRAGAALVQLYTGLVYEGPLLAARIARGLVALLERDGLRLPEATGRDAGQ